MSDVHTSLVGAHVLLPQTLSKSNIPSASGEHSVCCRLEALLYHSLIPHYRSLL